MSKSNKTKTITFESQLERMSEEHGIPVQDSLNVFSGYKKVMESIITEEVGKDTADFEFFTPLGILGFKKVPESERINTADGTKFIAPEHYNTNYAFPVRFIALANVNVDFSKVPTMSDITKSKLKVA